MSKAMFQFKPFDAALVDATRAAWCAQAKEHPGEIMVSSYQRLLDWVERIVNNGDNNTYVYALAWSDRPDEACAILEMSHARPSSYAPWLKVLSIHIEPRLEVAACAGENLKELARVVSNAVAESLGLTFREYPSTQLKVYASTPLTVAFLEGVAGFIEVNDDMSINVSAHGNWLIIDKI